jgi:ABC-type oligopeptide transport system substrate-binding subunit
MRRWTLSAGMLLSGASLLAASALASVSQAPPANTFRMSLGVDIDSVDPALAYSVPSWTLEYATGAMLLNYPDAPAPKGSQLVPEVAAGFPTISRDGRTYTFRLKRTYRFSSGGPVRAGNFVRAFRRARDPRMDSPAAALVDDVVAVRAVGFWTLKVRTKGRAADLLARLATPFFAAVPKALPIDPDGVAAPVPAAGPYFVREWVRNRHIVLERNRFYRGPRPHNVDRVIVDIGLPHETIKLNIDRGITDTGDLPPAAHAELGRQYGVKRGSPGRYFANRQPTILYLALNEDRELFRGNVPLRQAVNSAIDRRAMMLQYAAHGGSVHDQLLPPAVRGFRDFKLYPPDLARARALAEGHLRGAKAVLWCSFRTPFPQICQIVQKNLREIGLAVDVGRAPRCWPTVICDPTQRGAAFDMLLSSHRVGYLDPYDFMKLVDGRTIRPSDNTNLSYFRHRGFDRRIARANRLIGAARYRAFSAIDRDVMRQAAPVAVIGTPNDRHYVSARTGCYHYHPVYGLDLPAICLKR